jgi:hypothetical protein
VTSYPPPAEASRPRPALGQPALHDIAVGLARSAERWSTQLPEPGPQRTGLRVIGTPEYDAWLLQWPPGTAVTPHDHGASLGAFIVVIGELTEVRWERGRRRARCMRVGDLASVNRGVVHDVIASGTTASLSVHVYSPPLEVMGFYEDDGLRLLDRCALPAVRVERRRAAPRSPATGRSVGCRRGPSGVGAGDAAGGP